MAWCSKSILGARRDVIDYYAWYDDVGGDFICMLECIYAESRVKRVRLGEKLRWRWESGKKQWNKNWIFRGRVLNPERQFCSFHIPLVNESRLYDWPCENITYMHIHYSLPDSHPYSRICTCDTIVLVIILWESVIDTIWRTESTYFVRIWIISLS